MADNIDECAQCGGVRVSKSTLCVDCLAVCCLEKTERLKTTEQILQNRTFNLSNQIDKKDVVIKTLKESLKLRTKLYQEIFEAYQELLKARERDQIKIDSINRAFR